MKSRELPITVAVLSRVSGSGLQDQTLSHTNPPHLVSFARMIGGYSSRSLNIDCDQVNNLVRQALQDLGHLLGTDSCYLLRMSAATGDIRSAHLWSMDGKYREPDTVQRISCQGFTAWSKLRWFDRNHSLPADTPDDIRREYHTLIEQQGLQAFVNVPLFSAGRLRGALGMVSLSEPITIDEESISLLQALGQVLTTALITANQKAQFQSAKATFMKLVSRLDEAVYRMSLPDGHYEYLGPSMERVFGFSASEILARPLVIKESVHPDYREFFRKAWENLLKGVVPPTYEYKIVDATNCERWILQSNHLILDRDGRPVAIEGICRNITEQRRLEDTLRASQERFQAIIENTSDIIMLLDEKGVFTYLTPSLKRISEFELNETVGRSFQDFLHEDDRPLAESAYALALKSPGQVLKLPDIRARHKNGGWIWYEGYVTNLLDNEAVNSLVVCCRDITERKAVEQQLRDAQESLEERVNLRTRELAEVNEHLEVERISLRDRTVALREVLGQIQSDRTELARQVQANVEKIALPILDMMDQKGGGTDHYSRLLRSCLLDITSPLTHELGRSFPQLTSREQEVCRMVKDGFTCKQIAQTLSISPQTVIKQRKSIRRKLGLTRKSVCLTSYLRSLGERPVAASQF